MASTRISDFLDALRTLPLLEPAQVTELNALAPQFSEIGPLIQQLTARGWLTRYQAKQLAAGRGNDLLLDQYVLLELLGEGGMGTVFAARQSRMKRRVAIKVLKQEAVASPIAVERFQREAEACARLSHPNIVTVHDANQVKNIHFLVMEFIDGIDLARLVQEQGALPVAKACDYVRQAARGLQHAHEQGLVHRDVKPQNLMLTKAGIVKLMDLGLARLARQSGEQGAGLTGTGAIMGTPYYMAPEQVLNAKAVDIRADIYSLGATLYHLLAGRPPFAGLDLVAMVAARVQGTPPEPLEKLRSDLPAGLLTVVQRMMAPDPADRYSTPAEVTVPLEAFAQGSSDAVMQEANVATVVPQDSAVDTPSEPWPQGRSTDQHPMTSRRTTGSQAGQRPSDATPAWQERAPRQRMGKALLVCAFLGAMTFAGWHFRENLASWIEGFTRPNSTLSPQTEGTKADSPKTASTKPDALLPGTEVAKLPPKPTETQPQTNPPTKPMLHVSAIKPVSVEAGQTHVLPLQVVRENCKGPIEVRLENLPKGVTARPGLVPIGSNICRMELTTQEGAAGIHPIKIVAIAAGARGENTFTLMLTKPLPRLIERNLGGGVKLELVRIRPGTFRMGAVEGDPEAAAVEKPQHDVVISKDFYLGKYTVTHQQFARFVQAAKYETEAERDGKGGFGFNVEKNQSGGQKPIYNWRNTGFPQTDRHPVVNVTWNDAQAFCAWASITTGERVELPTEAEWEYACRAGTNTRYFTGDPPGSLDGFANVPDQTLKDKKIRENDKLSFFEFRDGFPFTAPVGSFKPNPWGLYDMTGNVFQWCRDGRRRYPEAKVVDPVGPDDHSPALRGGSWVYGVKECRCSSRWRFEDGHRNSHLGFRVVVRPE